MMISVMSMATKRKEASKGKYTSELLYREYLYIRTSISDKTGCLELLLKNRYSTALSI